MFSGVVSAQSTQLDIVQTTEPANATNEQLQTVETWFYENADTLTEEQRNTVGSWVSDANQSSTSSGETQTSDEAPDTIEIDVSDNIKLVDYTFTDDAVEITLYASQSTEQVVLSQYVNTDEAGVKRVPQKGVTVPRKQQVTTSFETTVPISVSAGVNQTISISDGSGGSLVDSLSWNMVPTAGLATALAMFSAAALYVSRRKKKMKDAYTNVFRKIK